MSLYEMIAKSSKRFSEISESEESSVNSKPIAIISYDSSIAPYSCTIPSVLRSGEYNSRESLELYYISDLHIDTHILSAFPNGATDELIISYIDDVVKKLFTGEFRKDVQFLKSPIVLFGGDISSNFTVTRAFFCSFVSSWRKIAEESYNTFCSQTAPIEQELAENQELITVWENKHVWTKHKTKPLSEYASVPRKIKEACNRVEELYRILLDITKDLPYDWKNKYIDCSSPQYVYAVLGNHELWDFDSYEDCVSSYSDLFSKTGIILLENSFEPLGKYKKPLLFPEDKDNPEQSYETQLLYLNNVIITGSIGYAVKNTSFNASQMIYGNAIDTDKEKNLSEKWISTFNEAIAISKELHSTLVVLSHMPVTDWLDEKDIPSNCVFFSGHTHRNLVQADERNCFLFADNQVGYRGKHFSFKKALLHKPNNPFASDPDGYRSISILEYKEFYRFMGAKMPGTGMIEWQMKEYCAELYVVKSNDYYGFFMISPKGTYICNGGLIPKIGKAGSMQFYYENFDSMVQLYLRKLSPLRSVQEQMAAYIKSIGGRGRIHGTIVDIDHFNHVMFLPDGSLSYYYSPVFGYVKSYPNMKELLENQCPELSDAMIKSDRELSPLTPQAATDYSSLSKINIRESPYMLSRKISALQRLFDNHILRGWNTSLLISELQDDTEGDTP